MEVDVSELEANLSEYVRLASAGQTITITDAGRPMAQSSGLGQLPSPRGGMQDGWIEDPQRPGLEPLERVPARRTIREVLDEDRGD